MRAKRSKTKREQSDKKVLKRLDALALQADGLIDDLLAQKGLTPELKARQKALNAETREALRELKRVINKAKAAK
jgi:hypothetical protein